jgi:tRNA modification GTPase
VALDAALAGRAPELVAADLRTALDRLGEVAGAIPPDDVLGRLFAGFCIGK